MFRKIWDKFMEWDEENEFDKEYIRRLNSNENTRIN